MRMSNIPRKTIIVILLLITELLAAPGSAFAAQSVLAEAEIPVRCVSGGHTTQLRLIADTPETPMPAGAEGGVKDLTLQDGGEDTFGKIVYTRPDIYHYTVRKEGEEIVYHVSVIATNDGKTSMVVTKDGDTEKSELIFHEAASAADQTEEADVPASGIAATGDPFPLSLWAAIFASAAALLILLATASADRGKKRLLVRFLLIVMILSIGANTVQVAEAKTLKVTLHRGGTCSTCGKKVGGDKNRWGVICYGGPGATNYRWVSYTDPVTGKKSSSDAYCLEPSKVTPDYKKYSADYINPNRASGKWKNIAKILYFSDDGPGGAQLKAYLKKNKKKFPDPQSARQRFAMIHEMLAYAFDPGKAFKTTEGRTLDASYQKQVKALYKWCISHTDMGVADPKFSISPSSAEAIYDRDQDVFISEPQTVSGGSKKQYFSYKVPAKATMVVKHDGQEREYKAAATAAVYVGDSFWFRFDPSRASGIPKTTVAGEEMQVMPYKISIGGKQDIGFYVNDKSASSAFSVFLRIAESGNIKIQKKTEDLNKKTAPEADVRFRIWNTEYEAFEDALRASTGAVNLADTVTTDTEGIAISEKVAAGSYYVEQTTTKTGYRMMEPNPKTVTVTKDNTTVVDNGVITDPELGICLRCSKTDGLTGERITGSSAVFGVYSDEACEDLICTVTTAAEGEASGTGTSVPMAPGIVYVKELTAPNGYVPSREIREVKLSYSAENREEDPESGEVSYIKDEEMINWKPQFHDVVINKTVQEGSGSQEFAFDIRISGLEISDKAAITSVRPEGTRTEIPLLITDGKAAADDIRIRSGGQILLEHLPVGAKYTITERGTAGYKPSFKVSPEESVRITANMGQKGEPLSVTNEVGMETEEGMENVRIVYDWKNTREISHSLQVEKKAIGIGKDDSDRFHFTASFNNISGMIPGYVIYSPDDDGDLKEETSSAPEETADTEADLDFVLSSGEKIRFFQIMPNAGYTIREDASDYIASYRVTRAAGVIPTAEAANEKSDTALQTGDNTMPGADADEEAAFLFENNADEDPVGNRLFVEKRLSSEETDKSFRFTAELFGLKANSFYCYLKEGSGLYTMRADLTGAVVEDQDSAPVAGVPFRVTRADGKSKYYRTEANGTVRFSKGWIGRGGNGDVTISWIGDDVSLTYDEDGEETEAETSAAEGYDLTAFQANQAGEATASFELGHREELFFPALPAGSGYKVTEAASSYEPSYEIYRDTGGDLKKRDEANGGTRTALETDLQTIPAGSGVTDLVSFTNTADTKQLKVTKTVSDGATDVFPFTATFAGLSRSKYIAVTKGAGSARVSISQNGDIEVAVTGAPAFGGDWSGIPIKFVRGDNAARTVYTDVAGKVAAGAYIDWLTGYDDSHKYRIEFLGQTYDRTW
ncbi:MAG: hypothetical protein IJ128_07305 [Firmicutes bacterium]|nr:hypothetical protein [Bacillota bacterium]